MVRLIACALILLLGCGQALAETASKTVRDWTATCDDYSCWATVAGSGGLAMGQTGYQLEIARAAGGNDAWMVTLIARNVAQPDGTSPVVFTVPGFELPAATLAPMGDDRFTVSDQAALEAVFPALRKGSGAKLAFTAADGRQEVSFSLSGIAAVLLWIDERQGQVGNSTKVVATSAGDVGWMTGEEGDRLRAELIASSPVEHCQWNIPGEGTESFAARYHDLGNGYALYIVTCSVGAYQPSTMVFVRGADIPEQLAFAEYSEETGWTGTDELGTVDFDPKTGVLRNYTRFRGPGDCGTASEFAWTGHRFKLLKYAYKKCPGSDEPVDENADLEFPVIYEAK